MQETTDQLMSAEVNVVADPEQQGSQQAVLPEGTPEQPLVISSLFLTPHQSMKLILCILKRI